MSASWLTDLCVDGRSLWSKASLSLFSNSVYFLLCLLFSACPPFLLLAFTLMATVFLRLCLLDVVFHVFSSFISALSQLFPSTAPSSPSSFHLTHTVLPSILLFYTLPFSSTHLLLHISHFSPTHLPLTCSSHPFHHLFPPPAPSSFLHLSLYEIASRWICGNECIHPCINKACPI